MDFHSAFAPISIVLLCLDDPGHDHPGKQSEKRQYASHCYSPEAHGMCGGESMTPKNQTVRSGRAPGRNKRLLFTTYCEPSEKNGSTFQRFWNGFVVNI
jgi:hypothetical protein